MARTLPSLLHQVPGCGISHVFDWDPSVSGQPLNIPFACHSWTCCVLSGRHSSPLRDPSVRRRPHVATRSCSRFLRGSSGSWPCPSTRRRQGSSTLVLARAFLPHCFALTAQLTSSSVQEIFDSPKHGTLPLLHVCQSVFAQAHRIRGNEEIFHDRDRRCRGLLTPTLEGRRRCQIPRAVAG